MGIFITRMPKNKKSKPKKTGKKNKYAFNIRDKTKTKKEAKEKKVSSEVLNAITGCIKDHKLMSFVYVDRNDNTTQRLVEPYQVIIKGKNQTCLYAVCTESGQIRLFYLSRMGNVKREQYDFKPRFDDKKEI